MNKPAGGKAKEPIGFLDPDGIWTESRSKTTEQNSQVTASLRRFVAVNIYEKTALAEGTQFDEEQLRQSIIYYLDLVLTQSFSETSCMSSGFSLKELRALAAVNGARSRVITDAETFKIFTKNGPIWVIDYFAEEDLGYSKDSTSFLHTEHIVLVDKSKRIRGIYNGTLELEADQLVKDIKLLLKEE